MDLADFRRCARATGIAQMPQVEMPSSAWMTDTTDIIAHFEAEAAVPRLSPPTRASPSSAFCWKTCLTNGSGVRRSTIGGPLPKTPG